MTEEVVSTDADGAVVPDVGVIIVAAGQGTRTGSSELKQFRWIGDKPMLLHSVQAFQARSDVAVVVCVLPRSHAADPPPWLFQSDLDRLLVTVGGRTRMESVIEGLRELPDEVRYVVVHDAARPFAPQELVARVLDAARAGQGAIAALPVMDTVKAVDESGRVVRTVDRSLLWRAQTPQAFPRLELDQAYLDALKSGVNVTDEAAAFERMGLPVVVVRGSELAMKITEEGDFARLEALARIRE
ncbi:MAG TPA: 2-C-methyl-D-erythritol 4-phosphate cytidylyltransferase [Gemmatimonadales bacterium]|nr:2-C-methyl-D-erythritol 4-phosphate cytidylyltransferase [Gemmatimonadales bacterium]